MKALELSPSGVSCVLSEFDARVLTSRLGPDVDILPSTDSTLRIYVSKMWQVLEMELNAQASIEAGVVLGGTVILSPSPEASDAERIFAESYRESAKEKNSDEAISRKLSELQRSSQGHRKFQFHPPDRWIYNGEAFKSIVVGSIEPSASGDGEYNVWFFGETQSDPLMVKIVEFSLYEVLSEMISFDLLTAKGDPPQHFARIARHFSLI